MADQAALDAAREAQLRGPILAQVREQFDAHPTLQTAYLMVSQFWNDEAEDAVHGRLLFSERYEPSLDDLRDDGDEPDPDSEPDLRIPTLVPVRDWDRNGEAIRIFAAWCAEGSHQNMCISEAFRPIVLYEREREDITVTWVARPLRPWLDGVDPMETYGPL